ncbi:MAG: hypothetical protein IPN17_28195 [Deltaproteobacteria bacterium]|nr:hypothetical protein [Deltaproteobacteria bacterium]
MDRVPHGALADGVGLAVFPDPSTGVVRGDVDTGTPDNTECRYRYAICGIDGTGAFVAVSARALRGSPSATSRRPRDARGVYFSPGTSPLTGSGDWYLWTDTGLYRTPSDYAGTTNALRGDASWAALSLPASPGVVAGVAGYFNDIVVTTSTKLLRRTVGLWAEITGLTSRQTGRAIVWTGTALVELSSTGGDGIIYTATDPASTWTLRPTLTGVGVGTTWQLATGDTGVVAAFKTAVDVPEVWLSEDHGATWASVTTPALLKQLTALRWRDGVWTATSTVAPYAQTSGDLEHWLPVPIPVGESDNELRDVLYGNGSWLLVSRSGVLQGAPAIEPGSEGYTPGTESSIPGNAGWLRGRKISLTAPTDGQVYAWNAASSTFLPTTPSAGAAYTVRTKTTTYTALAGDVLLCDASGGAFTVTLPAAATVSGSSISVKKSDASANAVTVDGNAAETIDGAATLALSTQYEAVTLWSDGTNWWVF